MGPTKMLEGCLLRVSIGAPDEDVERFSATKMWKGSLTRFSTGGPDIVINSFLES